MDRIPEEFYKIREVAAWHLALVVAAIALTAFIAGYLFSLRTADFTMSDAQAKAYCTPPVDSGSDSVPADYSVQTI